MHIMWLDIYWEYYPLLWNGALEGVGAASYFAAHTPWEAAGRFVAGAAAVLKNAAGRFSPFGWPGGVLLFAAAVAGWRADADRPRRTAAAAAAAALFLPAAWYAPVDPSDRYMLRRCRWRRSTPPAGPPRRGAAWSPDGGSTRRPAPPLSPLWRWPPSRARRPRLGRLKTRRS